MRLLNVSIFFTLFLALVFITHSLLSLTHTQQFMYVCLYNYMYIFPYLLDNIYSTCWLFLLYWSFHVPLSCESLNMTIICKTRQNCWKGCCVWAIKVTHTVKYMNLTKNMSGISSGNWVTLNVYEGTLVFGCFTSLI